MGKELDKRPLLWERRKVFILMSPLLSNLMLDVLDKELERRGHRFVRYADDCNIYVRTWRAGPSG